MSACSSTQPVIEKPGGAPATGLTGTYWKLCELNGKPVGEAEEGRRREIFLSLNSKENRVSGNAGCNGFGGTYVLGSEGFRLRFSGMIRTQMACEGLELENEFLSVLENTDSYYVVKDTLQLNRARMAPLAKFVAVPSRAPSN
jgi:heat shock protein HslJ